MRPGAGTRLSQLLLWFSLFLLFAASFYACLEHRPLFADGTIFLLVELQLRHMHFHDLGLRFLTAALELPSMLLIWAFPHREVTALATRVFELVFGLYPWLGLIACAGIARAKKKQGWLLYPLLAFATGTAMMLPFASNEVLEVVTLLWPLLFLLALPGEIPGARLAWCAALLLALGITHEAALIPLGVIAIWLGFRSFSGDQRAPRLLLWLTLLAIASCVFRALVGTYPTRAEFLDWKKLIRAPDPFLPWVFLSLAGFGAISLARKRWESRLALILIACAAALVLESGFPHSGIWQAHQERSLALPVHALLAALFLGQQGLGARRGIETVNRTPFILIVATALGLAACRDFAMTRDWSRALGVIKARLQSGRAPCLTLAPRELGPLVHGGIWSDALGGLSILLQGSRTPRTIVFAARQGADACALLRNRARVDLGSWQLPLRPEGYFKAPQTAQPP